MPTIAISTSNAGLTVLHNPFAIKISVCRRLFIDNNIGQDIPESRKHTILNRAMVAHAEEYLLLGKNQKFEGRPHSEPAKNGYELVRMTKGTNRNTYEHLLTSKIEEHTGRAEISDAGPDAKDMTEDDLNRHLDEQKDILPAADVTAIVTGYVQSINGCTNLRERGGVYHIPKDSIPLWDTYINCLLASSPKPSEPDYFTAPIDENACRTLRKHLLEEIRTRSEEIRVEVLAKKSRDGTLDRRRSEIEQLKRKCEVYRDILADDLDVALNSLNSCMTAELAVNVSEVALVEA